MKRELKIERKRNRRDTKIILGKVEAKLNYERRKMDLVEYQARQSIKSMVSSRPMGSY